MLIGTLLGIVFLIVFLLQATHPHTSRTELAILGCLIAFALSLTYAPWMASYTEAVEAKNPALVGTGLALWGWILRLTVAISFIFMPIVISTVTPIVNATPIAESQIPNCNLAPATSTQAAIPGPTVPAGTSAATFVVQHADSVAYAQQNAAILSKVTANYRVVAQAETGDPIAIAKVIAIFGVTDAVKLQTMSKGIATYVTPYACQLAYVSAHQAELTTLQKNLAQSPKEWQRWFWVDVAGMVVFLPFIFLTKGRWSPKAARKDRDEQEAAVAAELAALNK